MGLHDYTIPQLTVFTTTRLNRMFSEVNEAIELAIASKRAGELSVLIGQRNRLVQVINRRRRAKEAYAVNVQKFFDYHKLNERK